MECPRHGQLAAGFCRFCGGYWKQEDDRHIITIFKDNRFVTTSLEHVEASILASSEFLWGDFLNRLLRGFDR
jgi:hypothetical protein